VWHEDVEAYAAHDATDGELQGYFFLDLHPRAGKYAHQCVYPLQPAFGLAADGTCL
jgi:thimet oligopeptidase